MHILFAGFLSHSSFRLVETVDVCIVASLSVSELLQS